MDVKYINYFSEVLVNTFETSINQKPFRSGDFGRLEGDLEPEEELLGIMTFGGTLTGAVLLCVPDRTARLVYKELVFEDAAELDEEVEGAFQEILSMLIGNLTPMFEDQKIKFDDPIVAANKKVRYENEDSLTWLEIPMAFKEIGKFRLIVGVKES